jgi:ElaB/YqjD/DUF883 family membrane-anchored ribosome-binding protein
VESVATEGEASGRLDDLQDQIARMRDQLDVFLKERVTPAVAAIAGQADQAVRTARAQGDVLVGHVKERPLTWVLIAAAVGWVIGRTTR